MDKPANYVPLKMYFVKQNRESCLLDLKSFFSFKATRLHESLGNYADFDLALHNKFVSHVVDGKNDCPPLWWCS